MNRYSYMLLTIGISVIATSSDAQDADKIYPISGTVATGRITESTRNNVVAEVRGVKENFPSNEIQRIVYETEPAQLSRAKELVLGGQWEEALDSLKKVDSSSLSRDEAKREFEYYVGLVQTQLALQGQGDPVAAETRLKNYVAGNTQSFHFYEAADVLGTLAASVGGHDRAAKYFAALASAPFPEYKLKAQYMMGTSQLSLGNAAEARKAFSEAVAASADNQEAKRFQKLSKLGLIRCETADKKTDDAIKGLRAMVSESDATDGLLFAQIYNALGEAHRQAGQEEEALLAYLHTDLLFTSDPAQHAEALYYLSQLFGKTDPQRAADAKARLQSQYSNSSWARK
jgi:tetratricopeptide (TPR) repeat protein